MLSTVQVWWLIAMMMQLSAPLEHSTPWNISGYRAHSEKCEPNVMSVQKETWAH